MDRRLLERRRRVAEDRARSNLGRLVKILAVLALVAVGLWFAQSPYLSVATIGVRGAEQVDARPVLEAHGIVEGRPLLLLDVGGAEGALREDPWVASASVARDWPDGVVVEIEERTPTAVAELKGGRWLVASDAVLLEAAPARSRLPTVLLPALAAEEAEQDLELQGAVKYLTALPPHYRDGTVVREGEGGLEATVAGFQVRLGRPFDSTDKAAVTAAMIDSGLEEGAILTVAAPAAPAVLPPGATVPEDEESTTSTTAP